MLNVQFRVQGVMNEIRRVDPPAINDGFADQRGDPRERVFNNSHAADPCFHFVGCAGRHENAVERVQRGGNRNAGGVGPAPAQRFQESGKRILVKFCFGEVAMLFDKIMQDADPRLVSCSRAAVGLTKAVHCVGKKSLKANRVQVRCDEKNTRSRRVAELAGFLLDGIRAARKSGKRLRTTCTRSDDYPEYAPSCWPIGSGDQRL